MNAIRLVILILSFSTLGAVAENTGLSRFLKNYTEPELLQADEAFKINFHNLQGTFVVSWDIADDYYMYRDRIEVFTDVNQTNKLDLNLEKGKLKADPLFGDVMVFYHETSLSLSKDQLQNVNSLTFKYQGCADAGVCYPPQTTTLDKSDLLTLLGLPAAQADSNLNSPQTMQSNSEPDSLAIVSEADILSEQIQSGNLFITLGVFFIAGLLLAFTPCVFPMVPILSGMIANQGAKEHSGSKNAFSVSVVYVLAMALTYSAAGVMAGKLGENLQVTLQQPVVLIVFALVFVALAMSMFGFYDLQIPNSWQNSWQKRITKLSNKQSKGYSGVAVMGFLSALVVGPCVAPPLAGALIYIGKTGDALLGGMALFSLSLGMGTPLIAFGTATGKFLPRSGQWMQSVKAIFGVCMLAIAAWMLQRVVPIWLSMFIWGSLFAISGIYLGALEPLDNTKKRSWNAFSKGVGTISLFVGIVLFTGVLSGGQSLLQPLAHLSSFSNSNSTKAKSDSASYFQKVPAENVEQAIQSAQNSNKPSMIYFTADWCITCKELDLLTFHKHDVVNAVGDYSVFKVDVTDNSEQQKQLQQQFAVIAPPTILFIDRSGAEISNMRVVGFVDSAGFVKRINVWKNS